MVDDYIGINIKHARLKAGLTQEELAEQADVSLSVVSRLETGRTMVSVAKLLKIAEILDTFIGYFFISPEIVEKMKALADSSAGEETGDGQWKYPLVDETVFFKDARRNIAYYIADSDPALEMTDKELELLLDRLPAKGKDFFKKTLYNYLEIF